MGTRCFLSPKYLYFPSLKPHAILNCEFLLNSLLNDSTLLCPNILKFVIYYSQIFQLLCVFFLVTKLYQIRAEKSIKTLENEFKDKSSNLEYEYKRKIHKLEKGNNHLHKIIDRFYKTIDKFIEWICTKFNSGDSKELVKKFQDETHTLIDPVKQMKKEEKEKEWELEK